MRLLFALLMTLCVSMGSFAKTARDIFLADSLGDFNILTTNSRLDMLDYYDSGRKVAAINKLEGSCTLDSVTPQFLSIDLTDASSIEIWVSDTISKEPVVVFNHTYLTPVADGKLEFLNGDLIPLNANKIINMPTISDFIVIPKGDNKKRKDIEDLIDMSFISYTINPANGSITATQNMDEFLGKVDYEPLKKYLKKELIYEWNGKRYNLKK